MSNPRPITERDGTLFKDVNHCNAATSTAAYTRFSNYANSVGSLSKKPAHISNRVHAPGTMPAKCVRC
jgi:hypothetical protein